MSVGSRSYHLAARLVMTLEQLFRDSYFTGKKAAAQFKNDRSGFHLLYYDVPADHPIPPSVYLLDGVGAPGLWERSALVNYTPGWVKTYKSDLEQSHTSSRYARTT